MGKAINLLPAATLMGLADYLGADINVGGGTYGTRKVTRAQLLRQAELTEQSAPVITDTVMIERVSNGTPTQYKLTLGAIPNNILGKCKWVDGTNGSDSIGRPFKTISAAKAAASSEDTIIVGPGSYNEKDLLKAGVIYLFLPGATVHYTGASGWLFDDHGAEITVGIYGWGTFIYSGTDTEASGVLKLTHASSGGVFEFNSVSSDAPKGIFMQDLTAAGALLAFRGIQLSTGIYGYGKSLSFDVKNGIQSSTVTLDIYAPASGIKIHAGTIQSTNNHAIRLNANSLEIWADEIIGGSGNVGAQVPPVVLDSMGGALTIHNAKIVSLAGDVPCVNTYAEGSITFDRCTLLAPDGDAGMYTVLNNSNASLRVHGHTLARLDPAPGVTFAVGSGRFIVDPNLPTA